MFSKTCEYAIRAMLYIAQRSAKGHKSSIRNIAQTLNLPEPFIAKVLQDLVRKELLQSTKGPGGGFFLDKAGLEMPLVSIVVAVDGNRLLSGCGLGLEECSDARPCPIHFEFKKLRTGLQELLGSAKLGEFLHQLENRSAFLSRD